MNLNELPTGQTGTIAALGGDPDVRLRIQSMGLRVGRNIHIVRRAPMNGPLQVRLGTTDIMLRPQQAMSIQLA